MAELLARTLLGPSVSSWNHGIADFKEGYIFLRLAKRCDEKRLYFQKGKQSSKYSCPSNTWSYITMSSCEICIAVTHLQSLCILNISYHGITKRPADQNLKNFPVMVFVYYLLFMTWKECMQKMVKVLKLNSLAKVFFYIWSTKLRGLYNLVITTLKKTWNKSVCELLLGNYLQSRANVRKCELLLINYVFTSTWQSKK
jgi:hypothetical protein